MKWLQYIVLVPLVVLWLLASGLGNGLAALAEALERVMEKLGVEFEVEPSDNE